LKAKKGGCFKKVGKIKGGATDFPVFKKKRNKKEGGKRKENGLNGRKKGKWPQFDGSQDREKKEPGVEQLNKTFKGAWHNQHF